MRNNFLLAIAMLLLLVTSCKKDEKLTIDNQNEVSSVYQSDDSQQLLIALENLSEEEKLFFDPSYLSNTLNSQPSGNILQSQVNTRGDLDEAINIVMNRMILLNDEKVFIPEVIGNYGYAAWDQSIVVVSKDEDGNKVSIVHTPFATSDGTSINAYLLSTVTETGEVEFAVINADFINSIIEQSNLEFDISYHLVYFLKFDLLLFDTVNDNYTNWLNQIPTGNFQNNSVSTRSGCYMLTEVCYDNTIYVFQPGEDNQAFTRDWICFDVLIYFEDCSGIPNDGGGTWNGNTGGGHDDGTGSNYDPGAVGDGTTSTDTGWGTGPGGGGGSGTNNGGSYTNMEGFSQDLIDILQKCNDAASQTGDEGPGETIATVDASTQSTCDAISSLQAFLTNGQINALAEMDISLLNQVANYLTLGGAYEFGLVVAMINSGTELGFKEFKKLYELVVQDLKPILNSNEAEDNFLLGNPNVANQIKEFLDENPDLDVANFEVINDVAFLVDSDGVLHIFIEPLDMYQSNDVEKLNHVLNVLNLVRIYHCEYDTWYPIDWTDYLVQMTSPHFVVEWGAGPPNYNIITIGMNLNFTLASQPEHYLMGTSPDHHYTVTGTGQYKFAWNRLNTSIPMLSITVPEIHTSEIEAILYPSECD